MKEYAMTLTARVEVVLYADDEAGAIGRLVGALPEIRAGNGWTEVCVDAEALS